MLAIDAVRLFTKSFRAIIANDYRFLRQSVSPDGHNLRKCTDDSEIITGPGEKVMSYLTKVSVPVVLRLSAVVVI